MKDTFKQTDIGLIPESWDVVSIGDYCTVGTGGTPSTKVPTYYSPPTINWLKSGDIKGLYITLFPNKISEEGYINSAAKLHPSGSVMLAMSGRGKTRGTSAVTTEESACSQSVAAIMPDKKEYISEFIHYSLLYRYEEIRNLTGSYDRSGLNLGLIRSIKIPKINLAEQKKIALVLSKIQQAIETQEQIIKTTQELKKTLMQKLFTEGLNGEPQKQTDIGPIPKSWEVKELNEIADDFIGGGTPSTSKSDYWDGDIHWTTSKRLGESLYLDQGEKLITQKGLEESATHLIPKYNLLVGTRVGVGKVAILNVDMTISQDLTGVFINNDKFVLEFIAYQLLSDRVQEVFAKQQRGTTIKGITREDLKYQIKLAIPEDIEIQKLVVQPLINLDKKLDLLSSELENLKSLFSSSLNQLMTGQIRLV